MVILANGHTEALPEGDTADKESHTSEKKTPWWLEIHLSLLFIWKNYENQEWDRVLESLEDTSDKFYKLHIVSNEDLEADRARLLTYNKQFFGLENAEKDFHEFLVKVARRFAVQEYQIYRPGAYRQLLLVEVGIRRHQWDEIWPPNKKEREAELAIGEPFYGFKINAIQTAIDLLEKGPSQWSQLEEFLKDVEEHSLFHLVVKPHRYLKIRRYELLSKGWEAWIKTRADQLRVHNFVKSTVEYTKVHHFEDSTLREIGYLRESNAKITRLTELCEKTCLERSGRVQAERKASKGRS